MANSVNSLTGGPNRIAISHSMGGVAVRQVDVWNPSHWSGIVTMGSPLRGARIANSASNGTSTNFINNAFNQMTKGPDAGTSAAMLLPGQGLLFGTIYQLFAQELSSHNVGNLATTAIMNSVGLVGQTASDLSVGSAYMNGIAASATNTPKIFIWGSESDPIFWRTVGSMGEHDDEWGVNLRNKMSNVYTTLADVEYALRFTNPFFWGFHDWRGDQWAAGRNWVNYGSNDGWRNVIGAVYTETVWITTYENTCSEEFYYYYCDQQPDPQVCRANCDRYSYTPHTLYHNDPSDGVVAAPSQQNAGGNWNGYLREAQGVNHREMRTVGKIEPHLTWVMNGEYLPGVFRIQN
jgi:hypothetical protein